MRRRFVLLAAPLLAAVALNSAPLPAHAVERTITADAQRGLTLTLYQNGLGLVHDRRWVPMVAGRNTLLLEGLSERLILGSLRVYSSESDVALVGRTVRPADLTPRALLESRVGQRVLYVTENPETGVETSTNARLLSLEGGLVLEVDGRVLLNPPGRIALDGLPERDTAWHAEPSLALTVDSGAARPAELTLGYLTEGLSWQADYVADLAPDGTLDLTANVTLANDLAVPFDFAELRLVAGEVARERMRPEPVMMRAAPAAMEMADAAMPPPPAGVGDRYLYDTGLEVSLAPGARTQMALFQLPGLAAERAYVFEVLAGVGGPDALEPVSADLALRFDVPAGAEAQPLPAGTLRVYEALPEGRGRPVFAGAGEIGHTAPGGDVEISLGTAFDVTGSARRTAFERLGERSFEEAREIVVRNAKAEAVTVEVVGRFPPGSEIVDESAPSEAESAQRRLWTLDVPAGGEAILTYRVRVRQ